MQKTNQKKKRQIKPIKKPYLRGNAVSAAAAKRGAKLMVYPLLFIVINLFVGSLFSFEGSVFLRVVMNMLLVFFTMAILFVSGQNAGYGDVTFAEIQYNHEQEGKPVTKQDRDRCYHPLKGVFCALIGVLPALLLAVVYALTVQRQSYALQTLPAWVSSYSMQEEFYLPLSYYQVAAPFNIGSVLTIVMRLMIFPWINLAGARNPDGILLVCRLSPLFVLLPFAGYIIGYLRGRYARAMVHGNIAAADRKKRRKQNRGSRKPRQKNTELV